MTSPVPPASERLAHIARLAAGDLAGTPPDRLQAALAGCDAAIAALESSMAELRAVRARLAASVSPAPGAVGFYGTTAPGWVAVLGGTVSVPLMTTSASPSPPIDWGIWEERDTVDDFGRRKLEGRWSRNADGYHLIFKTQAEAERTAGTWRAMNAGPWRYTAKPRD